MFFYLKNNSFNAEFKQLFISRDQDKSCRFVFVLQIRANKIFYLLRHPRFSGETRADGRHIYPT